MVVSSGNPNVAYIECTNPVLNTYIIRWNIEIDQKDNKATYMEHTLKGVPTIEEIKSLIIDWYNKQIEKTIIEGFKWNDMDIWLSKENQINYKFIYDLINKNSSALPILLKFSKNNNDVYYQFTDVQEYNSFYNSMIQYIYTTIKEGWDKKRSIDWDKYVIDQ